MRLMKWLMPAIAAGLCVTLSNRTSRADGPATQPSGGTGTLIVNVVDSDGKAVQGAHVRVMPPMQMQHHPHGAGNNVADPVPGGGPPDNNPPANNPPADNPPAGGGGPNGGQHQHQYPAPVAQGETDANGSITFNDIPAGDYRVGARLKDVGMGREKATVTAGGSETITITLKPRPDGGQGGPGGGNGNGGQNPGNGGNGGQPGQNR